MVRNYIEGGAEFVRITVNMVDSMASAVERQQFEEAQASFKISAYFRFYFYFKLFFFYYTSSKGQRHFSHLIFI